MNKQYQVCTRCVMDTSAGDIIFDENGICNYCTDFLERSGHVIFKDTEQRKMELAAFVDRIKADGRGKRYDCVIGVSGGVDSSWALVQAVQLGLRPLAVHMDNNWNTELSQNNIANLVRGLGVDLYTHVIDWDEYRKLMQAFFDADVIDIELLYDNAMLAVNYQQALKQGVKYILAGTNEATEGMRIPYGWCWFKRDKRNIKRIAKKFGGVKLKTFPSISTFSFIYYEFFHRIKWLSFLDYFDYNKSEAMAILQQDYAYKPYPYKHYESIFTRFYQGYILPQKFEVDKRRVHLSTLVASGQMERKDALDMFKCSPYPSDKDLEEDKQYILKKMGWTTEQFKTYMARPQKPHTNYPTERPLWDFLAKIYEMVKKRKS
jgi:N-acetyl sugar amidotransferase